MVLSIQPLRVGHEEYHLSQDPAGRWWGRGSMALGLEGAVEKKGFVRLMRGWCPDGATRLARNAGSEARRPGWDLTFSAPKSVSVVWALGGPLLREGVHQAHALAAAEALAHVEGRLALARRGSGGQSREAAGLLVAVFDHTTSRAQDPQLHSHCLVLNLAVRADGTAGAVEARPVFEEKLGVGALYRAELAARLEDFLGLRTVRVRDWFEVAGVPFEVIRHFSRRRRAVEAALAKAGRSGGRAAAVAALATRPDKEPAREQTLFAGWLARGQALGFGRPEVQALAARRSPRDPAAEVAGVMDRAIARLLRERGLYSRGDLVRYAAEEAQGRGVGASRLQSAVDQHFANQPARLVLDTYSSQPEPRTEPSDQVLTRPAEPEPGP